jgi:voltage-gated potassium channel
MTFFIASLVAARFGCQHRASPLDPARRELPMATVEGDPLPLHPATARGRAFEILEHGRRRDVAARVVDVVLIATILGNVLAVVAQSVPQVAALHGEALQKFDRICVAIFALEYAARLWAAPEHPFGRQFSALAVRWRFARSPMMIIDALALLPWLIELMFPGDPIARLTRLVRFLKLARYSPAMATIGRVVSAERRALLACLIIIAGVLLAAAAAMMAVEGRLQPDRLGDLPKAMWWAASMLAKIGGGELQPVTALGSIVAAATVTLGIFCFALPVAILGRGFYDEIRRRDFVVTFAMVARIPLFAGLDPISLAEIVGAMRARTVPAGTIIVRKGDRGDAMYLIAAGTVEVELAAGGTRQLHEGDFFGEMALLSREPRNATVTASMTVDLLVIDAADFMRLCERLPGMRASVEAVARGRKAT